MTVTDLINLLKDAPQNAQVVIVDSSGDNTKRTTIQIAPYEGRKGGAPTVMVIGF